MLDIGVQSMEAGIPGARRSPVLAGQRGRQQSRAARRQRRRYLTVLYPVGECHFVPSPSVSGAPGTALSGLSAPGAAAVEQLGRSSPPSRGPLEMEAGAVDLTEARPDSWWRSPSPAAERPCPVAGVTSPARNIRRTPPCLKRVPNIFIQR
jgi:hypothetical protein